MLTTLRAPPPDPFLYRVQGTPIAIKFHDYLDGIDASDVRGAALIGKFESGDHRPTAKTGTSERVFSYNSVVLSILPDVHMTWGSFYDTNSGIEKVFGNILETETAFDIIQDGIGDIGSGAVVNGGGPSRE